jgi:hypothetical protein
MRIRRWSAPAGAMLILRCRAATVAADGIAQRQRQVSSLIQPTALLLLTVLASKFRRRGTPGDVSRRSAEGKVADRLEHGGAGAGSPRSAWRDLLTPNPVLGHLDSRVRTAI